MADESVMLLAINKCGTTKLLCVEVYIIIAKSKKLGCVFFNSRILRRFLYVHSCFFLIVSVK